MPLPISTKEPARVTLGRLPSGATPDDTVFLIRVPTVRDNMAIEAAVIAEGVRPPTDGELIVALREAVTLHVVDHEQSMLLAYLDEYEAALDEKVPAAPDVIQRVNEIDATLRPHHRPLAEFFSRRHHVQSAFALVRAEMLLVGIEGPGAPPVKRIAGNLTEETVEAIEATYGYGTMVEIGRRTYELTNPTEEQVGNSTSPQPSPPGPATSRAARRPRTEAHGISLESDTPPILN